MAMLPQICHLKSDSSHRNRWLLVALTAAFLIAPTWIETAQSQVSIESEATRAIKSTSLTARTQYVQTLAAPPVIEFFPQSSESERKFLEELDKPTTLDLKQKSVDAAIEILAARHRINIIVDRKSLDDYGFVTDTADVSVKVTNISLRAALKILLEQKRLGFYIEGEVLIVAPLDDLLETPRAVAITRTYPVGDLIKDDDDLESLSTAVSDVVPKNYESAGAPYIQDVLGRVSKVPNLGSLVVRQTAAGHAEVLALLRSLRQAKAESSKK